MACNCGCSQTKDGPGELAGTLLGELLGEGEFETAFEGDFAGEFETEKRGDPNLRRLQNALNRALGLRLALDGIAGPMTRSAVRSFQQRHGLLADGVAGPQTLALLRGATVPSQLRLPPLPLCAPRRAFVLGGFGKDSATLVPDHLDEIDKFVACVLASRNPTNPAANPIFGAFIVGHTDGSGTADYNFTLGCRRAQNVCAELRRRIRAAGISNFSTFLHTAGKNVQRFPTPSGNRRVEIGFCFNRRLCETVSPPLTRRCDNC